ncbi:phage tail protein [Lacticaseibacillus paracasei]|uniref:Phage tail protein n=1 Tax=Lacticaseibacillus paracasei TaxID=1597 RepID=A0ABD5CYI7_LACPA|nr:phage tail protein [Lacticaseibacillus paracasei]MDR7624959.1 phage tail protein [Lacticaseibacillus paracasei]QPC13422.1 phage tail protein [Lacticaseibacillus paracasei subsp. tolerans]QUS98703.1 phage tail protein [Lacticaseibacillus paracasei subsp. tolerans]WMX60530.1 phage tail protein [Lacticaseibacillus paracasei]
MQWFILSRDQHVLCAPSTDARNSLPIKDDTEDIVLSNNTAITSYEFTVDNTHPDAKKLAVGGYIAYTNKYHQVKLCTLIDHDGDDFTQTWHAEDIGMDLINEQADKVTYKEAHDFAYYANELLADTGWTLGVNEITTLTRTLSFDGQEDTKLKRIGDIANEFDGAELEFVVKMDGSTITEQVVNVWKKIGNGKTQQRFVDAVNLSALKTSGTIDSLHTAMAGYGSTPTSTTDTGQEQEPITFADIAYDDGRFFSPRGDKVVYDRVAGKTWARLGAFDPQNRSATKGYLVGNYSYDTSDPNELLKRTITQLKSVNTPKESYEADVVDIKADIGDYVQIAHHNYHPPVYLSARVLEVKNHYTVPNGDTAVFGNYSLLESNLDPRIVAMINGLAKQTEKYPWVRYADDDKGTNMSALPAGKKYMAIVFSSKTSVPSDDPSDYAGQWALIQGTGSKGDQGIPGAKGADGKTSYFHTAYANSIDGKQGFSTTDGNGKSYFGQYVDQNQADSTDPTKYSWALFKGTDGRDGKDGSDNVPVITVGAAYPSGPKKGDMHWLTDSSGVVTGYYTYDGTKWNPYKIDAKILSAETFNGMTFNGVTFTGSKFISSFKGVKPDGVADYTVHGTTTMADGKIVTDTYSDTDNSQVTHTELSQFGLLSQIYNKGTLMDSAQLSLGMLTLSGNYQTASNKPLEWITSSLDALRVLQLTNNNLLVWHGAFYPQSGDTATISTPLSKTLSGWLIAWSYYQNGSPTYNNYAFTLLPKAALIYNTTGANYLRVTFTMKDVGTIFKVLWYDDTHIVGTAENNTGSLSKAVMTEVYAV